MRIGRGRINLQQRRKITSSVLLRSSLHLACRYARELRRTCTRSSFIFNRERELQPHQISIDSLLCVLMRQASGRKSIPFSNSDRFYLSIFQPSIFQIGQAGSIYMILYMKLITLAFISCKIWMTAPKIENQLSM